jgi:hypothetical protein
MPDVAWDQAAYDEVVADATVLAVSIVARRIVDDAKPITRVLRTRPPGRRERGYSMPAGRLRESIGWELVPGPNGGAAEVGVGPSGIPLAYFQGFSGQPAYGGSRAHRNSIGDALLMQVGREVP